MVLMLGARDGGLLLGQFWWRRRKEEEDKTEWLQLVGDANSWVNWGWWVVVFLVEGKI